MTLSILPIEQVRHRHGARLRTDEALSSLASSIGMVGLIQPIRVRQCGEGYEVVAGSHRLQACELLGLTEIACFVVDDDDLDAEMAMIAENLHRAELTKLEYDEQLARWAELAAIRLSDKLSESPPRRSGRPGIAASASRELRIGERVVQRAVKVASLSAEAKVVARETGLDNNRAALLSAARQPTPAAQVKAIQHHHAQRGGGIAGRYTAEPSPADETLFIRFLKAADWFDQLDTQALLLSAGRQQSRACQRARGIADKLETMLEGINR